jgi:hypothetical protein
MAALRANTARYRWRLGIVGHVGVPDRLIGAERADRNAVFDDVRDHRNVTLALFRRGDKAVLARHLDPSGGDDRRPVKFAE